MSAARAPPRSPAESESYNASERARRARMGSGTPNWMLLTPLAFALLPLVGHVFKSRPVIRNRLFFTLCVGGVLHGVYSLS